MQTETYPWNFMTKVTTLFKLVAPIPTFLPILCSIWSFFTHQKRILRLRVGLQNMSFLTVWKGKKERKMANTWIFLPRVRQGFAPDIHFLVFSLFIPKRVQPVSFQNYYSDVDKMLRKGVVSQNNLLKDHPLFYRFLWYLVS